jgi:hypothetical protein
MTDFVIVEVPKNEVGEYDVSLLLLPHYISPQLSEDGSLAMYPIAAAENVEAVERFVGSISECRAWQYANGWSEPTEV